MLRTALWGEGEKKREKANRRRRASELSDVFLAFLPLLPSSPIHLLFPTAGAKEEGEKGTKRRRQNRNYPYSHASPPTVQLPLQTFFQLSQCPPSSSVASSSPFSLIPPTLRTYYSTT